MTDRSWEVCQLHCRQLHFAAPFAHNEEFPVHCTQLYIHTTSCFCLWYLCDTQWHESSNTSQLTSNTFWYA